MGLVDIRTGHRVFRPQAKVAKFQNHSKISENRNLLRNQGSLSQNCEQHYKVKGGSPKPMTGIQAI